LPQSSQGAQGISGRDEHVAALRLGSQVRSDASLNIPPDQIGP
jgi:hypothetical protein